MKQCYPVLFHHRASDELMKRYNKQRPFMGPKTYLFEGLACQNNYYRFHFETAEMLQEFEQRVYSWEMRDEMREDYQKMDDEAKSKLDGLIIEYLQKCPHCKIQPFYACHHIPYEDVVKLHDLICNTLPPFEEKQEIVTSKSERIASILHGVVKLFDNNDQCSSTLALLCGMVGCDMPHSLIDCTAKIITLPPNKLAMLEDVVTSKPGSLLVQLFQNFNKISVNQWYVLAGLVGEGETPSGGFTTPKGLLHIYQRVAQRLTEMEDTSIIEAFLKKI